MKTATHPNEIDKKILVVIALAWTGSLAHDLVEFGVPLPESTLLSLFVYGSLYLTWLNAPQRRRLVGSLMMAWSVINLVGGAIISVYPFAFLPFYPDQTLEHYGVHIYYGLAQIPLLWVFFKFHILKQGD